MAAVVDPWTSLISLECMPTCTSTTADNRTATSEGNVCCNMQGFPSDDDALEKDAWIKYAKSHKAHADDLRTAWDFLLR